MSAEFGANRPRTYIKSSDLAENDRVLFVTGGEWVKKDFSTEQDGSKEKTVFVAKVSLNHGEPKELNINQTSGANLADAWGEEDGDGWKGKVAKVSFVKMMAFGKMTKVLCLVPTDEQGEERIAPPEDLV